MVIDGRSVAQFPGEYTVGCFESNQKHEGIGVNFPGFLAANVLEELKLYTRRFIEGIGLHSTFCHTEFLYHPTRGWLFGEMGCRLPGGYQLPTESYIAQTDLLQVYLEMFTGGKDRAVIPPETSGQRFVGYYLFPKRAGRVKSVQVDFSKPWIIESKVYLQEGQLLEHEDSSVTMGAHVVYSADSIEELKLRSDKVQSLFKAEYCE